MRAAELEDQAAAGTMTPRAENQPDRDDLKQEMGPPRQNQAPLASARTAVKDQSPLRGAPLVPRSASLTAFLASASALLWGSGCSPLGTRETSKTKTNSYELC